MRKLLVVFVFLYFNFLHSQGNCLLHVEGSKERRACRLGYKVLKYEQGSKESQMLFDTIIELNPNYDWAYMEKSVPYLKRGFVAEGLELLDKAVELKPKMNLCYRAYWYFQYRNYKLCIKDIEKYYTLPKPYNQLTPGGDKDMRMLLGISYVKLGNLKKGIAIIEECIKDNEKDKDFYFTHYATLGMLYFKNKEYLKALSVLKIQMEIADNFPDSHYYLGLVYNKLKMPEKSNFHLKKALELFKDPLSIKNRYLPFRVYKSDVESAL